MSCLWTVCPLSCSVCIRTTVWTVCGLIGFLEGLFISSSPHSESKELFTLSQRAVRLLVHICTHQLDLLSQPMPMSNLLTSLLQLCHSGASTSHGDHLRAPDLQLLPLGSWKDWSHDNDALAIPSSASHSNVPCLQGLANWPFPESYLEIVAHPFWWSMLMLHSSIHPHPPVLTTSLFCL